jgi:hypothetical protein
VPSPRVPACVLKGCQHPPRPRRTPETPGPAGSPTGSRTASSPARCTASTATVRHLKLPGHDVQHLAWHIERSLQDVPSHRTVTSWSANPALMCSTRCRPGCLCGQHHYGEGACIMDRPASRRWDWHMRAARLTLRTGLRAGARRCRAMTAIWLFLRAQSRRCWRAWLSLALIAGVFAGGVVTAAAGALRTGSAYARFLRLEQGPWCPARRRAVQPELCPAVACCGDAGSPRCGRRRDQVVRRGHRPVHRTGQ